MKWKLAHKVMGYPEVSLVKACLNVFKSIFKGTIYDDTINTLKSEYDLNKDDINASLTIFMK
jgi:hypothetical protein